MEKKFSQIVLAKLAQITTANIIILETLKPISFSEKILIAREQELRWKGIKQRICDVLESDVAHVFPDELQQIKRNSYVKEIDIPAQAQLTANAQQLLLQQSNESAFNKDSSVCDIIESQLETIGERDAQIIRLRFGIGIGYPRTLKEVGRIFNINPERVKQIEAKAIRKLRHPTRSRLLRQAL